MWEKHTSENILQNLHNLQLIHWTKKSLNCNWWYFLKILSSENNGNLKIGIWQQGNAFGMESETENGINQCIVRSSNMSYFWRREYFLWLFNHLYIWWCLCHVAIFNTHFICLFVIWKCRSSESNFFFPF